MKKLITLFTLCFLAATPAFAQSKNSHKRMALLPEMVSDSKYVVYFRFAHSTLNPAAEKFVADVAKNYKGQTPSKVKIAGHADTVGSDQVNLAISLRRAKNVANALNRGGVPRNKMEVNGYGERRLKVKTGDNVIEPRNRRVEIDFVK